ncbi:hypothetical protein BC938DRAFT_477160 [Jimgerdemannia flammicorona]|uniref:Uncharacterized protein n=1 Tax=Jimgerdemannia flammicorona TaxID=994334 RepID=A0A433PBM7_9FUNG|nr:hypothetical protein BC938DRAFT_477160 [Jimgerdemannia flammicorona]
MLLADDTRVKDTGLGVERVHCGVDTQFSNTTGQDSSGIQMGESGGWGGIGQIVCGYVHGLNGGDGTLLGGGDTFLHTALLRLRSGLVTDSRGDTTQQGRHLGTGLSEPEDVVDEKQHILAFLVAEIFGDGQASEGDTSTGTWGLVHLTEHKGALGITLELDDTSLQHFVVQIVTLTGALADTAEDGETTVSLGNIVDELLNQHSLADTSTTKQANLATTDIRSQQVDDLDTGFENFGDGSLVNEFRSFGVDGQTLDGLYRATLINGLTDDVNDAAEDGCMEERNCTNECLILQ